MSDSVFEIERQKRLILEQIPSYFYNALGPYEFPRYFHTFAEVKSLKQGRMEVEVIEIFLGEEVSCSDFVFPDQLSKTIWPDVTCTWDPKELASLTQKNCIESLSFQIESSIEFDSVDIDTETDTYEIWDSFSDFITDQLIDHCMYDPELGEDELMRLVEKQPLNLRPLIYKKCEVEIRKMKSGSSC